ncbi:unnamed protein product, partial [marine sediment metagenome]
YHLEDDILLFGFSPWPLAYLKQKLPRAKTVIILVGNIALPLNKLFKSISLNVGKGKFSYIDIIDKLQSTIDKESDEKVKQRLFEQIWDLARRFERKAATKNSLWVE